MVNDQKKKWFLYKNLEKRVINECCGILLSSTLPDLESAKIRQRLMIVVSYLYNLHRKANEEAKCLLQKNQVNATKNNEDYLKTCKMPATKNEEVIDTKNNENYIKTYTGWSQFQRFFFCVSGAQSQFTGL